MAALWADDCGSGYIAGFGLNFGTADLAAAAVEVDCDSGIVVTDVAFVAGLEMQTADLTGLGCCLVDPFD